MKKMLSIMLAVVMLATMAFTVSAADVNLLGGTNSTNNADGADVTGDANGIVIEVKKPVDAQNNGFGAAIAPKLEGVDVRKDGGTGFIKVEIDAEVPFRLTMNDENNKAWVSFGGEFFNVMIPEGFEFSNPDAPKAEELLTDNEWFPAGKYNCTIYMGGVYEWKAQSEPDKWDATNAYLSAFYLEGKEPGTIKVNKFMLTASENGEPSGDEGSTDTTTTTKKQSSSKDDNPKTGVESDAVALAVVVLAAAGVVTLSVVSKKAKSR